MIDRKYQTVIFSLFMALFMSSIMSLVITVFNVGLVEDIVFTWLKAWSFSFTIAFPATLMVSPVVKVMVGLVMEMDRSVAE